MKKSIIACAISASLLTVSFYSLAAVPTTGAIPDTTPARNWSDPITVGEALGVLETHLTPKITALENNITSADTKASNADSKATNAGVLAAAAVAGTEKATTAATAAVNDLNTLKTTLNAAFTPTGDDGNGPSALENHLGLPDIKNKVAIAGTAATKAVTDAADAIKAANKATTTANSADSKATNAGVLAAAAAAGTEKATTTATAAMSNLNTLKTTLNAAFTPTGDDGNGPSALENHLGLSNIKTSVTAAETAATKAVTDAADAIKAANKATTTANSVDSKATNAGILAAAASGSAETAATAAKTAATAATTAAATATTGLEAAQKAHNDLKVALKTAFEDTKDDAGNVTAPSAFSSYVRDLPIEQAWKQATQRQINDLYREIDDNRKELRQTAAKTAALSGLFQPYGIGNVNVTAAMGGYKDEQAAAVGVGYRVNETFAAKAGIAFGSGSAAYNVGVNLEF
ncbi:YadA C-terminal domain-containing protein [Edwardsiella tarda]|uniref:YadA C-terminal domain-containing protein n=1 Tax=Edwardsiella tarda TaxID=636 RepID=UPI0039BE457F